MVPLRGLGQSIVLRMHIEGPGSYDEENTWICIVSCSCIQEFLDPHNAVYMHNMLANICIDSQYGAKQPARPQPYAQATCIMSHVRVWTIYIMDMHHILIILESKCAKYIMNDALQMHVIGWLLHKSARGKWHRLHQHSRDAFGGLYMYMVSR